MEPDLNGEGWLVNLRESCTCQGVDLTFALRVFRLVSNAQRAGKIYSDGVDKKILINRSS
jgi:hypothetical protein